ncbi:TerC family protein [Spirosoma rhododendri]|uniref:TerC family protein n=1 Tax=Spirosoma rhododendri TaxID=2728024 RepID=A0A7L5DH37_9BACT|nr:TerC family protein [Spirosoma rhododendri]QJD77315.1 TerC family protein [Spirosoma rhododendri]
MSDLFTAESIISLLTLTFLEIVLGIDNIIFISIAANKLVPQDQGKARNIGLILAMAFRLALLTVISVVISLSKPFTHIDAGWFKADLTGQSLILFGGGLFLLYKATSEIHHKLEGGEEDTASATKGKATVSSVVTQIAITNIVFSIDSILTAIGLTQNVSIMMIAVVLSIGIMMFFAGPVGKFVNEHPTIQMLGLAFLIMIGFMLVAEGAHLSDVAFFNQHVGEVPKGYLYFAIAFSLLVEFLNIRLRKAQKPVHLHPYDGQPGRDGVI